MLEYDVCHKQSLLGKWSLHMNYIGVASLVYKEEKGWTLMGSIILLKTALTTSLVHVLSKLR